MWCVFSPRTLMCSAAPRLSASERKKCGTSSVGSAADLLAREAALEDEVGAPRQIDGHLRLALIHRQQEAVAADAGLVAERRAQRLAERERAILDGVVLIDVQVAVALERRARSRRAWRAARACDRRSRCRCRCGSARSLSSSTLHADVGLAVRRSMLARGARAAAATTAGPGLARLRRRRARDAAGRGRRGCARELQIACRDRRSSALRAGSSGCRADTRCSSPVRGLRHSQPSCGDDAGR